MTTAIIGGGAAGLSLALMLHGDVTVLEAEDAPGGLCRSTTVDGFTFDQGPHILGGIPQAVAWIRETTGVEFVEGRTNNRAWIDGEFAPHPFTDERVAQRYMAKMWKRDPASLALAGLGAQPGRKPGGVPTFLYPKRGGYQAITDAWAAQLGDRLVLDTPARADVTVADHVVSTVPCRGLAYNTLATVTLGYEGIGPDLTALYIPGLETSFHRLSFPTAFSAENTPAGCFSVQGEVTFAPSRPKHVARLTGELRDFVYHAGISRREPVLEHCRITPYAYPVPEAGVDYEQQPDVHYHGRTGAHRYLNVDGVVAASMALAERLNA